GCEKLAMVFLELPGSMAMKLVTEALILYQAPLFVEQFLAKYSDSPLSLFLNSGSNWKYQFAVIHNDV
ncbi:37009_t:CDS:2, partial [Racocetra persica]